MKKINFKDILLLLVFIFVCLSVFLGIKVINLTKEVKTLRERQAKSSITIEVYNDQEVIKTVNYYIDLTESISLKDFLEKDEIKDQINVSFDATGFVTSVDGLANASDWSSYWCLFAKTNPCATVNQYTEYFKDYKSSSYGCKDITLYYGDCFAFRYSSFTTY